MSSLYPAIEYKIILIGNSGVGKTSFFRKLSTGEFAEANIATIGVEKISFDINITTNKNEKKKIDVSLFDTAGQEKFRALTRQYYKGTDGVLLLYDITDRKSFENVEMWIDSLNESIDSNKDSKYVIILIGNKKDLINEEGFERNVSEEEAKNICGKFNMKWGGECSTKDLGKEELMKIFESYTKEIYDKIGEKINKNQKIKNVDQHKQRKKCCASPIL